MDALICDDEWDPKPEVIEDVKKEVDEVVRYFVQLIFLLINVI